MRGLSFSAPNELQELSPRGLSFNASIYYQGASTTHVNPVGLQVDPNDSVVQLNIIIAQNTDPCPSPSDTSYRDASDAIIILYSRLLNIRGLHDELIMIDGTYCYARK